MPVHLTQAEALKLGILSEPSSESPAAEPTSTPPTPETPTDAVITPLAPAMPVTPPTQAYALLSAVLRVSAASYTTPQVARLVGGYAIRAGDALAYSIDITQPDAITVTTHARNKAGRWGVLEARRYPKMTPREFLDLFVTRKD